MTLSTTKLECGLLDLLATGNRGEHIRNLHQITVRIGKCLQPSRLILSESLTIFFCPRKFSTKILKVRRVG